MVYEWKSASRIKANPNEAAKVMNQLAETDSLTAENLVEVSKPESSPLHNDFEWDDTIAAIKYRNHQARNIINALVIVPDETIQASEPVRAYFKIEQSEPSYKQLTTIVKTPSQRDMLLQSALAELIAFKKKYTILSELKVVFAGIDETIMNYG